MACLLKIESPTRGWEKSLEKLLKSFNDVNYTIDKRSKTVYVYGKSDPEIILEKIRKTGLKVEIVWSNLQGSKKAQENRKEHFMEQCCNSLNAPPPPPNGFWNYNHHQQCYYPPQPPPNWMNHHHQMQPHHQFFGLLPPYQPLEQPPSYEFKPNEPAAKSFPANAPQPKNFTMGDLQLCNIM